jgi:hypothetical protein
MRRLRPEELNGCLQVCLWRGRPEEACQEAQAPEGLLEQREAQLCQGCCRAAEEGQQADGKRQEGCAHWEGATKE